ncbi:putative long-chain fatty-acid--CoA ligase [Gordonia hirsuta DSM 44140 = NBRC 16056]|uniref:Putative long-chain fatty-acid--CoA ligase n=1 Tax=Gordonia hirsuta DSM 44140 = NBRC 16056 TaxID=1121927 RepID=L7L7J9_9ACTN|nr:class I adenylate-forming enzyme family protein [Gordonia hirsuta]GAC56007.1 putative long-chain fatty-acid--CoA ligase [Gordonia hirsuta DSM 44140 = NBRC 16056]
MSSSDLVLSAPQGSLYRTLVERVEISGEAVYLIDGDRSVTYSDLLARVDRVAAGLTQRGIGPGDRVAIALHNRTEWIEAFLATARIGAILVTLNVRYRETELLFMLADSGSSMLISEARMGDFDFVALHESIRDQLPDLTSLVYVDPPTGTELDSFEDLAAADPGQSAATAGELDPGSPALILYTSGTTGTPKGAVLTHRSLLASAAGQVERTQVGPEDKAIAALPFNHVGGVTCTLLAMLLGGGQVLLMPAFSPAQAAELLRHHGVTVLTGVPMMMRLMLAELAPGEKLGVRLAIAGGSNVEPALFRAILEAAPQARLMNLYGLSESSGAAVMSGWNDDEETLLTTLGTALEGVEARVVDPDGNVVDAGVDGELQLRGDLIADGYWDRPEATAQTFVDGWLATGDMVVRSPDGHLTLRGRSKEMYIQGGYNVYPAEVENVLVEHPTVAAAAGVGKPDPVRGEVGYYFVISAPGTTAEPDELIDYCRQRLANYKVPVFLEIVDELPTTPAGKIRKADLQERVRD